MSTSLYSYLKTMPLLSSTKKLLFLHDTVSPTDNGHIPAHRALKFGKTLLVSHMIKPDRGETKTEVRTALSAMATSPSILCQILSAMPQAIFNKGTLVIFRTGIGELTERR